MDARSVEEERVGTLPRNMLKRSQISFSQVFRLIDVGGGGDVQELRETTVMG